MAEKKLNQLKSLSQQKHRVKRKHIIKDIALENPEVGSKLKKVRLQTESWTTKF